MTAPTTYDILGLGNAIVDVLCHTDEETLQKHGLIKGSMRLIDEEEAQKLYDAMSTTRVVSGGSAANTIAGAAMLKARTAFAGKVANDELGKMFAHDIKTLGVDYNTLPLKAGAATARSFILVTPDGERTMNTYLGAAQAFGPEDIFEETVASSAITYLEGYLWDPEQAKAAFLKAADIAHKAGRKVALTLSDTFCVDRYREEFLSLMRNGQVDIVFANESELHALYQTSDLKTALNAIGKDVALAVVTRSSQGCVIVQGEAQTYCPAENVENVVDTTGAGDLFAAGFLAGFVKNLPLEQCAKLGAMAAAEVISHIGARPEKDLCDLAAQSGIRL
jgi:sugar/nucleoside kinase (ribokinase family)